MAKRWYVVHAYSGFEKQVKKSLEDRIERSDMQDLFGEVLVPTEEVVEMKGGQKRRSDRKFFPGYVLVEMEMTDDAWHLVRNTPKVTNFIGNQAPTPVPDHEIASILQQMETGATKPTQIIRFEEGDEVRVIDGAFGGWLEGNAVVDPDGNIVQLMEFRR